MNTPLRAALLKLVKAEDGFVSASALTVSQQRALDAFSQRTGAVQQQRSGRGRVFRMVHPGIVEQHLADLSPFAGTVTDETLPGRAANLGHTRSSKGGTHGHDQYYLLLKARGDPVWQHDHGQTLDLNLQTQTQGAGVLAITPSTEEIWRTNSPIWLVENQALFDRTDWLPGTDATSLAWYSGHLRNHLIDWLAQQANISVTLFPDYDGVGLFNYLRLKQQLGSRARFWLMPDWHQKLQRFGSNALWQDTQREFRAAAQGLEGTPGEEPELKCLMDVMQRSGLALEQEAIWLQWR
ncbi:hypothetical protein [Saccharospirillum sp.]|uniref:DUF7281 domain-containing protein n=1 Tax=Saccharospirillum sp. TaxID=2033801 RepID=UPI0034A0688F